MPRSSSQWSRSAIQERAVSLPGFEMIPTVLMMGIEEELPVPFGAKDGAIHDVRFKSEFAYGLSHPLAGRLVEGRVADDAALAHLELRLDQYNRLPVRAQQPEGGGEDEGKGDEADVAGEKVDGFADLLE